MKDRSPLDDSLPHHFRTPALRDLALTHRSATVDSAAVVPEVTNERLEFLGDRVLGLSVADLLYTNFPHEPEGNLARRLATLVSRETLAKVADSLNLQDYIEVGGGGEDQAQKTDSIAANACEALIGAIYLDAGFDVAKRVVVHHWQAHMEAAVTAPKDAKTTLQELVQGQGLPLPVYTLLERTGPAHAPEFTMTVYVEGYDRVQGIGASKRIATQAAAEAMLRVIL
ncbi:MAG: ribonuclease III [Rhodospirillaceae bacterium]|jgi:ribonuclease III